MDQNETVATPPPLPMSGQPSKEERQWAMFAHLSALAGGLLTSALGGWGMFLGPLVIWLMKKDEMPFVADQAKEALNFNITVAAVLLILTVLGFVTLMIGFILILPIMVLIGLAALVFIILAAVKANEGVAYRYPLTIRLIK
ncbi:DUF4870 domain-containing protein [Aerolutibacter ruishenii]|uniref:Tic20 family protein n=1 Tax=Aerolutibacter ruishenii TaxID=686800 RepID=A0A562LSR7_9GAMM|nr:DUF4870 domain-containing protein [Lysobacter ruishenii]TWI10603.1 hypothetical protein IP93_01693 [Lysobacter ruishenii]